MKISNLIFTLLTICFSITFSGCDDRLSDNGVTQSEVTVLISRPAEAADANVLDETYSFRNVSSSRVSEFHNGEPITLIPGLYDVTYTAEIELPNGACEPLRQASP